MKRIIIILILTTFIGSTSCVKASKSCKQSQKKMKKMRKSGQLRM